MSAFTYLVTIQMSRWTCRWLFFPLHTLWRNSGDINLLSWFVCLGVSTRPVTLISDAGSNLSSSPLSTVAFCSHSSTSGEWNGGNTQSKSEIIMQTGLWGSLMTKVSLRCSSSSALEYQLGLSGMWSWQKVTGIVSVYCYSLGTSNHHNWQAILSQKEKEENKFLNLQGGVGRWCNREDSIVMTFQKKKETTFVGTAFSISSRYPQLILRESSPQMCCKLLSSPHREVPFLCSLSLTSLLPFCNILQTTRQGPGNQMLAEPNTAADNRLNLKSSHTSAW